MSSRQFSTIAALLVVFILAMDCTGNAQPCCDAQSEPCLKFLDDFARIGSPCPQRDPYEERIETERHDFTQSTTTVGRGVFQIESGYTYFYKDQNEEIEQAHTMPEMLLRYGLSDDIEFRVRWTYAWAFTDEGEEAIGSEDLKWSFKFGLTDQRDWIPESAIELRFTAPTGGRAFSTTRVESGFDLIYGWELVEGWELYGSTGYSGNGLGDFGILPDEPASDRFGVWSQSLALGTVLSEKMTVYNEFFGLFSYALEDDFSIVVYNIGIDYYVSDNFVLDVRVGKGLTPDTDDFFSGIGGGYRF